MEPVNPLGAEARARLQAYRREMPSAAAFRSDWSRIAAAIARDEPDHAADDEPANDLGGVSIDDGGSVGRWAVGAGLAVAIAATVLLLLRGAIAAATALGVRAPAPMEAIDRAGEEDRERTSQSRRPSAREPVRATAPPSDPSPPAEGEGPPETRVPATPPSAATAPVPSADPGSVPDPDAARLAEETRLLRAAREALAAGDLEGALRSVGEHARRFPAGALLEERMLYGAIARCRRGESQAAEAFLGRFPKSPHAPRVRSECGGTP